MSAIKTVVSSVCSGVSALSGLSGGSGGRKKIEVEEAQIQMMCSRSRPWLATLMALLGLSLAGCAGQGFMGLGGSQPEPAVAAVPTGPAPAPPRYAAQELVGRWGMAAFHRPEDRTRIEVQAKSQCTQPYVISASAGGAVKMYGHDKSDLMEMTTKGTVEGKTYVGPPGEPAGTDDREIVSFDGRVLVLKWVDPEVAGRYGTMVLVRCGPKA